MPTRITLCIMDGFSGMVLSCVLEPLRAARDLSGASIEWSIVTPDGRPATSSSGLTVTPDDAALAGDVLIVLAGYDVAGHMTPLTMAALHRLGRTHNTLIAADAAPWFFAELGWLNGMEAVIHWQDRARFTEAYPAVRVTDARFAKAGRVMTCGGAAATLSLMLAWISEQFGKRAAFDVSRLFLHDSGHPATDASLPDTASPALRRALTQMEQTIEAPVPLSTIAKAAAVSPRTLDRLFQTQTQMSPGRYYLNLRLARAHELSAETQLTQAQIAARCGYTSSATLAKAYRAQYGRALGQTRRSGQV